MQQGYCKFNAMGMAPRLAALVLMNVVGVASALEPLSAFTTTIFVPDGEIAEFIHCDNPPCSVDGDSQEYFVTDPGAGADFGSIKAAAVLTRGVFVRRDDSPATGPNAAGLTGFQDPPLGTVCDSRPSGFNIGRVFASFNPNAYAGEGAYFLAMDVSAPAIVEEPTQPVAFDVDGDGSRFTITELIGAAVPVSEAPETTEDFYGFLLDTDQDGLPDVDIRIEERIGNSIPFGTVAIDPPNCGRDPALDPAGCDNVPDPRPAGCPAFAQVIRSTSGDPVCVRRYVRFDDLSGTLPGTPPDQALVFLDANDDGVLNAADFGIDSDVEIVVRNAGLLPENSDRVCLDIIYIADSFNDEPCGGAEEAVELPGNFPLPDIEVIKEARCVGETEFRRTVVNAPPGADVEFRVTIQNWGNRDLDVTLTDVLTVAAGTTITSVTVADNCASIDPGPPFNELAFCNELEAELSAPARTAMISGIRLEPIDECDVGLGEQLIFTFQVRIGDTATPAICSDTSMRDIRNAVSVTGMVPGLTDPILPANDEAVIPDPDDEEEHCEPDDVGSACNSVTDCCDCVPPCVTQEICDPNVTLPGMVCVTVGCPPGPLCTPGDLIGDVQDEFTLAVSDEADMIDTRREVDAGADNNTAEVEIECRNLAFTKRARQLTPTPAGPFHTGDDPVNLPNDDAAYPLRVEFEYRVDNTGENAETINLTDASLCADLAAVVGADPVPGMCSLCDAPAPGGFESEVVSPGVPFIRTCVIEFATLAAAQAFAMRDDARTECRHPCDANAISDDCLCYKNCASVTTKPRICFPPLPALTSSSTLCFQRVCRLTVTKNVRCLDACPSGTPLEPPFSDPPFPGAPNPLMTVPGACAQFEVLIANDAANSAPVRRVCIDDSFDCTFATSGYMATIGAFNVTADLVAAGCGPGANCCATFPSLPNDREAILPGETLRITFNVQVPSPFGILGDPVDCQNVVEVEGFEQIGQPESNESCRGRDQASIDVKVPRIQCAKTVAVDQGNDGPSPDDIAATTLALMSTPRFPVRLTYSLCTRNAGELPISDAQVCDEQLVADAVNAGMAVGPCALCNGDGCNGLGDTCAMVGALPVSGPEVCRTCQILIADDPPGPGARTAQEKFAVFAGLDGTLGGARPDCYTNSMTTTGTITPPCAPPGFPRTVTARDCMATVCIPVIPECVVTKARFDIWNQNERRFSGTERCIISWDQRLLSRYTVGGIANHFGRRSLQTDKGKARIDGIASSVVCGEESLSVPLLGVAAKIWSFPQGEVEMSGLSLVGVGNEVGVIKYDLPGGGDEENSRAAGPPAIPDTTQRADITAKGSLVVYPKVEIKWDAKLRPIQDTFLDLTNDYAEDVNVQLYFVNGDQPLAEVCEPACPLIGGACPPECIRERAHLGCNAVDVQILLTADQPVHWSALTGDGGGSDFPLHVSPFTILDPGFPPGRPDDDPLNPGGRVLRGYVLAWAVNFAAEEIRWNHLYGDAVIVNYHHTLAWDYNTYNFAAIAGAENGDLLLPPLGQLDLDGIEYAFAPDRLVMEFLASGARPVFGIVVDTDLTLWAVSKDLRQP